MGDSKHVTQGGDPLDMDHPSLGNRDVLVSLGRRAQEFAPLIVSPTGAGRTERGLEAAHRPGATFDPAVVLLEVIVLEP